MVERPASEQGGDELAAFLAACRHALRKELDALRAVVAAVTKVR